MATFFLMRAQPLTPHSTSRDYTVRLEAAGGPTGALEIIPDPRGPLEIFLPLVIRSESPQKDDGGEKEELRRLPYGLYRIAEEPIIRQNEAAGFISAIEN